MVAFGSPVVPEVKPSSATSSRPVCDGVELDRLVERDAIELGVMVRGAVEVDDLFEEFAGLGAGHQLVGDAAVGERQRDLGLVDDLAEFAGAQHRHGVDDDGAGLGGGEPGRDQRRIVAGADQHAVARLDAVVLDQRMGQPVRPVGEFLIGAAASVADQRGVVAKAFLDHAVGQFDADIEPLRILEFRPVEQKVGPLIERRQVVAREGVDMRGRAEGDFIAHGAAPEISDRTARAMMTFWTSDAPS